MRREDIIARLDRIEALLEQLCSAGVPGDAARVQSEAAILRARGVDLAKHLRERARRKDGRAA